MSDVLQKLTAARTRLILDKPFIGALVLRLPLKEAHPSWCQSAATDAHSFYYNASYIESLSLQQVQFVLAHEAMHCGLCHFARRQHRNIHRWNIACDHAVNLLLLEDKLEPVPEALCDETYKGLAAEEIYPLIKDNSDEETMDQHLYDSDANADSDALNNQYNANSTNETSSNSNANTNEGNETGNGNQAEHNASFCRSENTKGGTVGTLSNNRGSEENTNSCNEIKKSDSSNNAEPQPGSNHLNTKPGQDTPSSNQTPTQVESQQVDHSLAKKPAALGSQEREELRTQWQQRLVSAAQQASQAGKMTASVSRLIDRVLRSTIPWRTLLARFMSGSTRTNYDLMRPSQRRGGDAILPSLHARQVSTVVAIDTSGSIENEELNEFIAEINAIKSLVNARITLLACDNHIDTEGPWVFEPWEQLTFPSSVQGGGGTDFSPVFEWISQCSPQPDLVIYFTDAQGRFPLRQPLPETLWLVKGPAPVPWGQRIQLN